MNIFKRKKKPKTKRIYIGGEINGNPIFVEREMTPEEVKDARNWVERAWGR